MILHTAFTPLGSCLKKSVFGDEDVTDLWEIYELGAFATSLESMRRNFLMAYRYFGLRPELNMLIGIIISILHYSIVRKVKK